MADAYHKPQAVISKTQRNLKVGYTSMRHENSTTGITTRYSRSPSLHLKGNWLSEVGFETGTQVEVKVLPGCLIVLAQEATPPEPEIMQALRKVCKLSTRKQRQVTDLIEAISRPQKQNGN
ncbi:type I addiction module toxin, SymE family [Enterobacteriaceae bacterium BIT-l23]|uniref:SymE family type I addiction module toxin n=1 Tax=Jejubacter sp. L23 TaxID=3092086 RepID=UPI0015853D8C|nr:type I addiction module toxin, SymE family [Enterobacteriaceae bacterium BIT-l23]